MNVLLYGEVGAGKSTLIRDCTNDKSIDVGEEYDGVTKEVQKHFLDCGKNSINLVDCPGAGDHDRTVESVFDEVHVKFPEPRFGAVVIVLRGDQTRFNLGLQYVCEILNLALKRSATPWTLSTIVVATAWDRVQEQKLEKHKEQIYKIAKKISVKASMPEIPEDQIVFKSEGDVGDFLSCVKKVVMRGQVKLDKPSASDLQAAYFQIHQQGRSHAIVQQEYSEMQAQRRDSILQRLREALEECRYDKLSPWLEVADEVCMECDYAGLLKSKQTYNEWKDEVTAKFAELESLSTEELLTVASTAPYMYDTNIAARVFELLSSKKTRGSLLANQSCRYPKSLQDNLAGVACAAILHLLHIDDSCTHFMNSGKLFEKLYKYMPVAISVVREHGGAKAFCCSFPEYLNYEADQVSSKLSSSNDGVVPALSGWDAITGYNCFGPP